MNYNKYFAQAEEEAQRAATSTMVDTLQSMADFDDYVEAAGGSYK